MKIFIGDSLISALIGYGDTSWNVRNSATMTFTAAMLRVVDADKNAGGRGKGNRSGKEVRILKCVRCKFSILNSFLIYSINSSRLESVQLQQLNSSAAIHL